MCNNAVKQLIDSLKDSCNVEKLVLKVYAHFSTSAVRLEMFKSICKHEADKNPDDDIMFEEAKRHVITRWSSLGPAVQRLLRQWRQLRIYFMQEQPTNVDPVITELMINNEERTTIYLKFVLGILYPFQYAIKSLQLEDASIMDVHPMMSALKQKLFVRKLVASDSSTSSMNKLIENLSPADKSPYICAFNSAIDAACEYIDIWVGLTTTEGNFKERLSKLALIPTEDGSDIVVPTADEMDSIARKFNIDVNLPSLVEEEAHIRIKMCSLAERMIHLSAAQRWTLIFNELPNVVEYFKVMSFVISLPASSASAERTFSIMKFKARPERSHMTAALLRNEIVIRTNMSDISDEEFVNRFKNDKPFLAAIRSDEKYMRGRGTNPPGTQAIQDSNVPSAANDNNTMSPSLCKFYRIHITWRHFAFLYPAPKHKNLYILQLTNLI